MKLNLEKSKAQPVEIVENVLKKAKLDEVHSFLEQFKNPQHLKSNLEALVSQTPAHDIPKYMTLFVEHNLHVLHTPEKEGILLLLSKFLCEPENNIYYSICADAIISLLELNRNLSESLGLNEPNIQGYTPLYYVIVSGSVYIDFRKTEEVIAILIRYGAKIEPIEAALLSFFKDQPRFFRYTVLWVDIVKQIIFNGENLNYCENEGLKKLAIGFLTDASEESATALLTFFANKRDFKMVSLLLERDTKVSPTLIYKLNEYWGFTIHDEAILILLLQKKVVQLVSAQGVLYEILFELMLKMDLPLSQEIIQQQLFECKSKEVIDKIFIMATDTTISFLFKLIRYNHFNLFILFCNYFNGYCNFSFLNPQYELLTNNLFDTALKVVNTKVIAFLREKNPQLDLNKAVKGYAVLFRALYKGNIEKLDDLVDIGAQFNSPEYLKLSNESCLEQVSQKRCLILSSYENWRQKKKIGLIHAILPSFHYPPLVFIMSEYLIPAIPIVEIRSTYLLDPKPNKSCI